MYNHCTLFFSYLYWRMYFSFLCLISPPSGIESWWIDQPLKLLPVSRQSRIVVWHYSEHAVYLYCICVFAWLLLTMRLLPQHPLFVKMFLYLSVGEIQLHHLNLCQAGFRWSPLVNHGLLSIQREYGWFLVRIAVHALFLFKLHIHQNIWYSIFSVFWYNLHVEA